MSGGSAVSGGRAVSDGSAVIGGSAMSGDSAVIEGRVCDRAGRRKVADRSTKRGKEGELKDEKQEF